jgi:hypothetical protein
VVIRSGPCRHRRTARRYFIAALDDEDIAAITRIWNKLNDAGE